MKSLFLFILLWPCLVFGAGAVSWLDGVSAVDVRGKQTIWVSATDVLVSVTAGAAALANVETTAGRPDMNVHDFDTTTEEHVQFNIAFGKSWNLGTISFQTFWTRAASPTGGLDGVAWGLECLAVAADDSIDQAYGTEVVVGVDAAQSNEDVWATAESGAVTIAGTPADDDLVFCQISRVVASTDPLDDMDVDARFLGVKIFWTSDAVNDD